MKQDDLTRKGRPPEEWLLEQVLSGTANPEMAPYLIGISSRELQSRLRGLIDRRAEEQGWRS
jgi:hypothetical protein